MTRHCCTWQHKHKSARVSILKNTSNLSEHYLYIWHQNFQKSLILSQTNLTNQILQQTTTFLGETSSQTIANSTLGFIFPNGSIIQNNSGVYFQASIAVPIWVPNDCDFQTLKIRIDNTLQLIDKQYLDEIYYRQPFTDTGNQFRFQCMQLKNDDDVNTMLTCNDNFLCVGPIELLCIIGRTPDGILNLLQATMTPTHDALVYYNGRWNMSCQHDFVGYSFTRKNPKRFDITLGCSIDGLKDVIKQVTPQGIPSYGIHESQMVRRLFFWQLGHSEYS